MVPETAATHARVRTGAGCAVGAWFVDTLEFSLPSAFVATDEGGVDHVADEGEGDDDGARFAVWEGKGKDASTFFVEVGDGAMELVAVFHGGSVGNWGGFGKGGGFHLNRFQTETVQENNYVDPKERAT